MKAITATNFQKATLIINSIMYGHIGRKFLKKMVLPFGLGYSVGFFSDISLDNNVLCQPTTRIFITRYKHPWKLAEIPLTL